MEFSLRPIRQSDIKDLVRLANNRKISDRLTDAFPFPYTLDDGERFFRMVSEAVPPNVLAISLEDQFIGAIGIHPKDDVDRLNAEMGYWIGEPYWGQGIMTRAITMMQSYAFENFPQIERIFARPYGDNPASRRVLEKAGFVLEAHFKQTLIKNGARKDELIYAVRRTP